MAGSTTSASRETESKAARLRLSIERGKGPALRPPARASIVVPLNGSPLDERALSYATPLARATGALLHLVRAVPVHVDLARRASADPHSVEDLAAHSKPKAALTREATHLRKSGLEVRTHTRSGAAAAVILETAREFDAGLIVMASRARGGLVRWFTGSVADEVLRHSNVPVLVVRPKDIAWSPDGGQPRVLVGLDGSQLSEAGLAAAADLADAVSAELLLVRVVQPPDYVAKNHAPVAAAAVIREDIAAAEAYLQDVTASYRDKGRRVATRVVVGASPAFSLGRVASEENADAMAVATHGRGGLTRFALGSVTTSLLHDSPVPLLVVRPQDLSRTGTENVECDVILTSTR
jgi:nucleotide-binding universal stress UspA family protein